MSFTVDDRRHRWLLAVGLKHPNKFERVQFTWQAMDGADRKPWETEYISRDELFSHFAVFKEF